MFRHLGASRYRMSDGAAQRLLDLPDDLLAAILAAVCADDHFAASLATKRLRAARGHGAFRTRARATARSAALLAWGAAVGCPSPFPCWVIWRDRRCGKLLGHGQLQRDGQLLTLLTVEFGAGVPPREHGGFEDVRVLLDEVSSVEWIVDGEHLPGDEVCRSLFDYPRDEGSEGVEGFDADRSQQGGVEIAADQLASVARLFQDAASAGRVILRPMGGSTIFSRGANSRTWHRRVGIELLAPLPGATHMRCGRLCEVLEDVQPQLGEQAHEPVRVRYLELGHRLGAGEGEGASHALAEALSRRVGSPEFAEELRARIDAKSRNWLAGGQPQPVGEPEATFGRMGPPPAASSPAEMSIWIVRLLASIYERCLQRGREARGMRDLMHRVVIEHEHAPACVSQMLRHAEWCLARSLP